MTLCAGDDPPSSIASGSGSLYLTLTANSSTTTLGFRAIFYAWEDTCVYVISSGKNTITSPGYPAPYRPNLNCVWYIDVMEGVAKISFEDFDIPISSSCSEDRIEVIGQSHCYNILGYPALIICCKLSV